TRRGQPAPHRSLHFIQSQGRRLQPDADQGRVGFALQALLEAGMGAEQQGLARQQVRRRSARQLGDLGSGGRGAGPTGRQRGGSPRPRATAPPSLSPPVRGGPPPPPLLPAPPEGPGAAPGARTGPSRAVSSVPQGPTPTFSAAAPRRSRGRPPCSPGRGNARP